jgi:quercetin dioxygenase-like cupin family protein
LALGCGLPVATAPGTDLIKARVRRPAFCGKVKFMSIQVEHWSELTPPDPNELKERLQGEGYSVFQWSDAPGTKYGPHAHAEDQSHWILSGELEMRVGYETYILGPGDRDFLPANTMHSAFVPGDQPVTYLIGAKH